MTRLLLALLLAVPVSAQMFRWSREQMIRYTAKNPFERFTDGRPKVPESLLEKIGRLSVDEVWDVLRAKGYPNQYGGEFRILHPGRKLVGRAVTAQYLPLRPDLEEVLAADAQAAGMPSGANQKVIDLLQRHDVPVVDLMGAAAGHNFGGDNLQAAIYGVTRTGAVVDGTIRDLEGIFELPTQIYYKQARPEPVGGVSVAGINIAVKIGAALVLPGDVVLGDRTGVIFIPPHLAREVAGR